nr:MAG TPA: hypothetical protein [Bacteriophage sp.]DAZ02647.1 MAG TPA: hypothetical protein [Caudoviricetes sp.]
MIRIVERLNRFCSKFDLSILHRSEPRSLSSMWTYVLPTNRLNFVFTASFTPTVPPEIHRQDCS